jgi:hypothetical protein
MTHSLAFKIGLDVVTLLDSLGSFLDVDYIKETLVKIKNEHNIDIDDQSITIAANTVYTYFKTLPCKRARQLSTIDLQELLFASDLK